MYKYIFILFLTPIFFTLSAKTNLIKVKAKQEGNVVKVKSLIRSDIRGEEKEIYSDSFGKALPFKKILPVDFIKHIKAIDNNQTVFDLLTSPYCTSKLKITFTYKKLNTNEKLDFFVIDHKNKTSKLSVKIKNVIPVKISTSQPTIVLPKIYSSEIWKAKTVEEAIKKLYSPSNKLQDIDLLTVTNIIPKEMIDSLEKDTRYIQSSSKAILHLKSNIQLKSIAILSNKNKHSLAALITIPSNAINDYTLAIKTGAGCCQGEAIITVVAQDIDGIMYKDVSPPLREACSTTDGNCY